MPIIRKEYALLSLNTTLINQSTESTAGRAYMQIFNGWQARIQVFELEEAKFGEGSGHRLGPQPGSGRIEPSVGVGGGGKKPPEAPTI